jgi:hypothetical protein
MYYMYFDPETANRMLVLVLNALVGGLCVMMGYFLRKGHEGK